MRVEIYSIYRNNLFSLSFDTFFLINTTNCCNYFSRMLNVNGNNISFSFFFFFYRRANNNWHTNFASITKSNENSPQSNKKQRDIGESARDSLAYSCLLKNELLGTAIDDVKTVTDDRNENSVTTSAKRGLFKYQSPSKQVSLLNLKIK